MKKPNIVWFCTDQQRWDTITSLGNPYLRTPNIDRLVREGVAFERAYCQAPVCTPSRSSFLTGRYPKTTKAFFNGNDNYSKDETLITRILANTGYICGLSGKLHLTSAQGRMEKRTDDGYSYMQWSEHPNDDWPNGENDYQNWLHQKGLTWKDVYGGEYLSMATWPPTKNPDFTGRVIGVPEEYHQTTWVVEKAIDFINQARNTGKPWLISLNPYDPHPPVDPPDAYKNKLNPSDMPLPKMKDGEMDLKPPHQQYDLIHGGQEGQSTPIADMTEEEQRTWLRDYYAQIELLDHQLGRLIDYLEETGERENTIIIFMSDHGEMAGDHGLYWKGAYFYECLVHVPLIISWPGHFLENVRSKALVELVDIAPTILDLLELKNDTNMQGKSLLPILTGKVSPDYHKDSVYCEFYRCLKGTHEHVFATMYFDGRYKIVNYHGQDYGELYDLESDPNEYQNLWDNEAYKEIKHVLVKKNFDQAILNNMDFSMKQINDY